MLHGTIVENSLENPSVLEKFTILKSWDAGSWRLHKVELVEQDALSLSQLIKPGPWYVHFWDTDDRDKVLVVFRDTAFPIKHSDKNTWYDVIQHGRAIGIPDEQLDFLIDQ